jgi:hypothetical protein
MNGDRKSAYPYMEVCISYHIHTKTHSKWMKELNVIFGTMKLIEENKLERLQDTGIGKYF